MRAKKLMHFSVLSTYAKASRQPQGLRCKKTAATEAQEPEPSSRPPRSHRRLSQTSTFPESYPDLLRVDSCTTVRRGVIN